MMIGGCCWLLGAIPAPQPSHLVRIWCGCTVNHREIDRGCRAESLAITWGWPHLSHRIASSSIHLDLWHRGGRDKSAGLELSRVVAKVELSVCGDLSNTQSHENATGMCGNARASLGMIPGNFPDRIAWIQDVVGDLLHKLTGEAAEALYLGHDCG